MYINIVEVVLNALPESLFFIFKSLWYIWLLILIVLILKVTQLFINVYRIRRAGLTQIDKMSGSDFEVFLEHLFLDLGYKVQRVGHLGDYGADLIIEKDNIKTAVQAKRWNNPVNIKAIQEINTAKAHYNAIQAMVVTNNRFTFNATKLAKENNVKLVDRQGLASLILQSGHQK